MSKKRAIVKPSVGLRKYVVHIDFITPTGIHVERTVPTVARCFSEAEGRGRNAIPTGSRILRLAIQNAVTGEVRA
jgi:hypothetical protein